jgi:SPFH domain / Band 7 family
MIAFGDCLGEEMTMNMKQAAANAERVVRVQNGWLMLPVVFGLLLAGLGLLVLSIEIGTRTTAQPHAGLIAASLLLLALSVILRKGFFTWQPNEARVLVLFGNYEGTVRTSGFHWGNPFYTNGYQNVGGLFVGAEMQSKQASARIGTGATSRQTLGRNKMSLRARTLNGDKLKVNDKRGNPIEIAAVVVWRVEDTAQAMFDVDNYRKAAMVSNLMVVLCGESDVHPVLNTGTLYN